MKDVAEVPFNDVVSTFRTQFVIPVWQRLYAWEQKEWIDLWGDLTSLYEKREHGEQAEHFMGPVVLKTVEEKIGGITRRIVIDGQQRLTTLLLLLALIRNRAKKENNESLVNQIESNFLFNKAATKNEDKPKLRLTRADRDVFEKIIQGQTPTYIDGSQLTPAYYFFDRFLEQNKTKYDLEKLLDVIRDLKLVTIRLDEKDNPNRIFETLNYRGKELAQSDLVRNFFMMAIKDETKAEQLYNDVWFKMELDFGGSARERTENLEVFLRHYMTMLFHATIREDRVYAAVRELLKNANESEVVTVLKSISSHAKYYQRLLFPDRESNETIRLGLRRLNEFEITVHYPFLLKVYEAIEAGKATIDDFSKILHTIESYFVRRYFAQLPTNALNKLFASLCGLADVDLASSLQNELGGKESWSTQFWPTDARFKEDFAALGIYANSVEKCRFVLESLESHFGHPEPVKLGPLTIEHIMPEKMSDEWKSYLGANWENTFNRYVHTIGNLTLIAGPPNSSLQQDLFNEKKERWYKKSNVELTKELAAKWNEWMENDIKTRANELANRAIEIWKRP